MSTAYTSIMARLARIETLLGVPIIDVDETALSRLVDGRIREDHDLDFKQQLYGGTDSAKKNLAGDVAALANTVGGVLVLGVRDENAAAVELTPVELSDDEELRMRQIVASKVAPHPALAIHRVPSDADQRRGYYVIEVLRSAYSPHAVRVDNSLRYPRRDGSGIRWLSESEVADAYRDRFTTARQQVERLATIRSEGESALPELGEYAWLSMALMPNLPGEMQLTHKIVQELQARPGGVSLLNVGYSTLSETHHWPSIAGHRRIIVNVGQDDGGHPRYGLLHMHTDGGGFAAVQVGREQRDQMGERFQVIHIPDLRLTGDTINALRLLAHHAVTRCGADGDAAVEVTVLGDMPMQLADASNEFSVYETWSHLKIEHAPVGRHTVNLDEITGTTQGLVTAARIVLNDLVQGLGIAESPQLTADGALRIKYFGRDRGTRDQFRALAEGYGLEISEEAL